jgi:hypothetical protein
MANVHKATVQGKEVIVSGPFTYQRAQDIQQNFISKGINNVQFLSKEQLVITHSGTALENNQNNLTSQNQPAASQNNNQVSMQALRGLIRDNWPEWGEAQISSAIAFESEKIKKENPNFNQRQILIAVSDLWANRAKEKNNPTIVPVKVPNAVELANVNPLAIKFMYSSSNLQGNVGECNPNIPYVKCIDFQTYKKACAVAKNITINAAYSSSPTDTFSTRLLERKGAFSNIQVKWADNKCSFSYEVRAIFNGKLEGCRVSGLATGFSTDQDGVMAITVAHALYPNNNTCRLSN